MLNEARSLHVKKRQKGRQNGKKWEVNMELKILSYSLKSSIMSCQILIKEGIKVELSVSTLTYKNW